MIKLENVMEKIVIEEINNMEENNNLDCCTCEHCKADMAAMVLNRIPPKYVVSGEGALYSKLSVANRIDQVNLCMEIAQAAEIVKKNPRHPPQA